MKSHHAIAPLQRGINTLVQNGTLKPQKTILLTGTGTELSNINALKGRAKRKVITQSMVLNLLDAAAKAAVQNEKIYRGYWNTYYCQNKVYTANGRMYGIYCKNRFCTLCCSIRKAEIINKYLPVLEKWEDPYFITLTVKSVSKKLLHKRIRDVLRAFKLIIDKHRKRNQRGDTIRLMGLKAVECNFNPIKKTYNPHIHLIVPNKLIADTLLCDWQSKWTTKFVNPKGQLAVKVYNKEKALIEIIKYGSKIFTEPDVNNKTYSTVNRTLYVAALNNIFTVMKNLRIFERFGFNLPMASFKPIIAPTITKNYNEWNFDLKSHDWLNSKNDDVLTEYMPHSDLVELLERRIDTERD